MQKRVVKIPICAPNGATAAEEDPALYRTRQYRRYARLRETAARMADRRFWRMRPMTDARMERQLARLKRAKQALRKAALRKK